MRKIIICLDGTGNEVGDHESNVLKLYKVLAETDDQIVHYVPGVGTLSDQTFIGRGWQRLKGLLGLAFGLGLEDNVLQSYQFLCQTYTSAETYARKAGKTSTNGFSDDQIYIIGFSRGAYTARVLAGFLNNFGIITPDRLHLAAQAFRAYRSVTNAPDNAPDSRVFQALREYTLALDPDTSVPIRFLGLFDTVSSVIRIPLLRGDFGSILRNRGLLEFGTHASVNANPSVRIVRHALAIDERRSLFRPQFWKPGPYHGNRFAHPTTKRSQIVHQTWFPGYHSDIGGSATEAESGIGKLTLLWMLDGLHADESSADLADDAWATAQGKPSLATQQRPGPGLQLRAGGRARYLEGSKDSKTPGGQPYVGPDPLGPTHDSVWSSPRTWLWAILEIAPKSILRRDPHPAWFRRGLIWYLPQLEPRHIPTDHDLDPSAMTRKDAPNARYHPRTLLHRLKD